MKTTDPITALSDALPPGLVYAIERAISKAKSPGGQHTNGPTYASLEVSQLEFVLNHCKRGQVSDAADAARLDRLEAWRQNSLAKGFEGDTFQLTVDKPIREQLDAIQAQAGDAPQGEKA